MTNFPQTLVSFFALLALAVVTSEAQTMPTPDPACPANTIVSTPFNMPNGTACVLCSFIMDRCAASCSGSSADALQCSTDPEGCGEVVCPDGPPAPAPPTPVPPAPTPPAPTSGPVAPPPDVGTPESCGIANAVGCVLCGNGSDGSPDCGNARGGVDGAECNAYVPATGAGCTRHVKYTYDVDVSAPPYNAIYEGAFRYRAGSWWDEEYGNPREFNPDRVGDNITPWTTMAPGFVQYRMMQWEGEIVDFCLESSSVNTAFQFATSSDAAGECAISDGYELVTQDLALATPMSAEPPVAPEIGLTINAMVQDGMAPPADDTTSPAAAMPSAFAVFGSSLVILVAAIAA